MMDYEMCCTKIFNLAFSIFSHWYIIDDDVICYHILLCYKTFEVVQTLLPAFYIFAMSVMFC